jgi:two-component system phosphate regulon response regulator PhoB
VKTILVIEDEKDLVKLISFNLEKEGYRVLTATDGTAGLEAARSQTPDLIILDLMLPGINGIEICKILKKNEKTVRTPVIILTAKGEEIDRVVGFEVGADDYIVKPFSIRELLLRIKAILLRTTPGTPPEKILRIGAIVIDPARHLVTSEGDEIVLTTTEFKLLLNLAERPGRLQSRDVLLKNVWGYNYIGDTRTVDTHITRLRTKLGHSANLIKTVRGFGYKLEEQ